MPLDDPAKASRRIAIPEGRNRERVRELLDQGETLANIARILGVSKPTVCYHKRKLGYPMRADFGRRYDWAEINRYYQAGHSRRECVERFGCSPWAWACAVKRGAIVSRPQAMPLDELLINRPRSRRNIKLRLIAAGIKDPRCETCGISEWRDAELSLCLHHRNGDRHDNRLENLELLCPNCHSQTPNFGSRNWRREAA